MRPIAARAEGVGAITYRKAPAPHGSLEAYLRRAQMPVEAALARTAAAGDAEARRNLELVLHREMKKLPISPDVGEMQQLIETLFGSALDLITREQRFSGGHVRGLGVGIFGGVDRTLLERALAELQANTNLAPDAPEALLDFLAHERSSIPRTGIETQFDQVITKLLQGSSVLFLQGSRRALTLSAPNWPHRSTEEPPTEGVVRGPHEGFTESISTNVALVRNRIKDVRLRMEQLQIGELTHTRVVIAYVTGLCQPALVNEVHQRLERIKTEGIFDSLYLEEFIEDSAWTLFPLVRGSERPDVIAASLLEGRVAILTEGSPFALTVPTTFNEMMQSAEDYYQRFPMVMMIRTLRWLFASIALLGPAVYVAFTTFHQEMLPQQLLLSIMASREGVPFPAVVEALMMEISFEALREAGIRMPKQIGQAISIVGALVIGQAAVQAGIVSAPMVIVVSLTGLASFVVPQYGTAISLRMLRFVMLFLAGTFGAFGVTIGVLFILVHLLKLRSFGAPYYSPLAPLVIDDLDDAMIRTPHWLNRTRATTAHPKDRLRMKKIRTPLSNPAESEGKP